ncbi:MAG: hypothetical protein ACKO5C_05190 [Ferruginibacter sp.]
MKKLIAGALVLAILGSSCKKDDPVPAPGDTKFLNTAPGTTWNYKTVDNQDLTETPYTLTSTNRDSVLNGRSYHVYTYNDANGSSDEFYGISGNEYYQFSELAAGLPPVEFKYLVDNVGAGTSWTQPLTISQTQQGVTLTFNATLKYTIVDKGNSVAIGGKTYNNTIKVKTDIINPSVTSTLPLSITVEPITQDVYAIYAPKYGLIKRNTQLKVDINIQFLGTQNVIDNNTTTELISSNIP